MDEEQVRQIVRQEIQKNPTIVRRQVIGPYNLPQVPNAGTVTLGGARSGDGVMSVRDSLGTEVVKLDKNGITVNNGSITVQNASGSTTLDSLGIVSTNNFSSSNTTISGAVQVVTGTAIVDVTSSEYSFALNRSAIVFFPYSAAGYTRAVVAGTQNCNLEIYANINGTRFGDPSGLYKWGQPDSNLETMTNYKLLQLESGTQTFKLQTALTNLLGTADATIWHFQESYIILGR